MTPPPMKQADWLLGKTAFLASLKHHLNEAREQQQTSWMEICGLRVAQDLSEAMGLEVAGIVSLSVLAEVEKAFDKATATIPVLEKAIVTLEHMQPPKDML